MRLGALLLMFAMILLAVVSAAVLAAGAFVFSRIFPRWLELTADYGLMIAISFFLALLLIFTLFLLRRNKRNASGHAVTVAAWAIALIGFTVYLKIGNMGRLYGALSAIIVFMLWLYVLMICFVAGVIFNSEKISARESKAL